MAQAAEQADLSGAAMDPAAEDDTIGADIIVSGSRIVRDGYEAPTPTTVLGVEEIQRGAQIRIADQINQLPALAGSTRNQTASISGGTNGINALNLRNLGATRTLVLFDGQRMPAASTGSLVDIDTIPSFLIKRVDIVTGGASAAWGSDAVAGVVNFVLDKEFTGFKATVQGGVTTYGDNKNFSVGFAAGTKFAGGRGHLLLSAENAYESGVSQMTRPWYVGAKQLFNPGYTATNGQPQLIVRQNVGYTTLAPGGIITSTGPLKGIMFGPGGSVSQLALGSVVSDPFMVGGDWRSTDFATNSEDLMPASSRQSAFGRVSYEVTDEINLYAQFSYSRAHINMMSTPVYAFGSNTAGFVINRENPYLPGSVATAMDQAGVTSFRLGSWLADIGATPYDTTRQLYRYVLGANGRFDLFGKDWTWNAFWNKNVSQINQDTTIPITANLNRAVDVVTGPNGLPMCRSTLTNPTNGCVPLNVMGIGVASSGALNYVVGHTTLDQRIIQDEFQATVSGEPFSTWAGPVSVAFGFDHRRERGAGVNDPLSSVNSYYYGNYKPIIGSFKVTEGFFETVVPLATDMAFAKSLDFNGAIRVTDYSTSGTVTTWKVGSTWAPVDDLKLRVTYSADIRAGNLTDLFQPGLTSTITVTDTDNSAPVVITSTVGNPTIRPEKARTLNVGGVFTPTFLPGFSASVDYWRINVDGVISTLSAQNTVNLCAASRAADVCGNIIRNGANTITSIILRPVNLALSKASGIDVEASYHFPIFGDGQFTIRGLATRYLVSETNTGLVGAVPISALGSATPKLSYRVEAVLSKGPFSTSLVGRGVGPGVLDPNYIQCASACGISTAQNRTIDNNHVNAAVYFDVSGSYKIPNTGIEAFGVVQNIVNSAPVTVANSTSVGSAQWGASGVYYDRIGRSFRLGVRLKY